MIQKIVQFFSDIKFFQDLSNYLEKMYNTLADPQLDRADRFFNFLLYVFQITTTLLPFIAIYLVIMVTYYGTKYQQCKRLTYTQEFSARGVFEGEDIYLVEHISNRTPLPVFFVDIKMLLPEHFHPFALEKTEVADGDLPYEYEPRQFISRFHLLPFGKVTRSHRIKCGHRGFFKLEKASVYVRTIRTDFDVAAELFVYPRIVKIPFPLQPINQLVGSFTSLNRIVQDPFSFSGIRDYTAGDAFNTINFKATARSADYALKVNKREFNSPRVSYVCVNFTPPNRGKTDAEYYARIEFALSYAASILNQALKEGYTVGLCANCELIGGRKKIYFPLTAGYKQLEQILRALALVIVTETESFSSLLCGDVIGRVRDAEVYVLSCYLNSEIQNQISAFKRWNNNVTFIDLGAAPSGKGGAV